METSPHHTMHKYLFLILAVFAATGARADQPMHVVESFEQNYIRQLSGEYLVPILVPSRQGMKLCAVSAAASTRQIVERFLVLLDELSLKENSAYFVSKSGDCPSGVTALIQFSDNAPEKDFVKLLEGPTNIFGLDMSFPSYPHWSMWEGAKTAFQLDDNYNLYSITVVRTSVPDDVLKAYTIKAMFQLSTTSQIVEWAGPFFSIAQTYEPEVSGGLVYEAPDAETSIVKYTATNAVGLCTSDVVNMAFLVQHMTDGASPTQAQAEISRTSAEIESDLKDRKIFERFADILDHRCTR